MKKIIFILGIFLLTPFNTVYASNTEITLFDSQGSPIAYIAVDEELTIFTWKGSPVAYLKISSNNSYDIYGFNGKHLGWYEKGLIIDHEGYVVGFSEGAVSINTKYEPYKGYKQYAPYRAYTEYAPYKPYIKSVFSKNPLILFLTAGKN